MAFRNRAQCKNCGDIIESVNRHDWVPCSCFPEDNKHGFYLDGGKGIDGEGSYIRYGGNYSDIIWLNGEEEDEHI